MLISRKLVFFSFSSSMVDFMVGIMALNVLKTSYMFFVFVVYYENVVHVTKLSKYMAS